MPNAFDADSRSLILKDPILEPEELVGSGFEFRAYRGEEDLPGIRAAVNLSLAGDGIDDSLSLEGARAGFGVATPGRDPATDVFLALAEGRIVGAAKTGWYEERADKRLYCVLGYLAPEFRGLGLYRELLRLAEARAGAVAAGHPGGIAKILQAWSAEPEVDWPCLLASEGYREVRHFWDMLRPIDPEAPAGGFAGAALPPDLELHPVDPTERSDLRAVWEAIRDVAPDHWQYRADEWTEASFEAWLSENVGGTAFWQLAWEGERVVSTVLASLDRERNERLGAQRGLTEHVFTRRERRGQGIATALLARALAALAAAGMDEAFLGVDEENPSGAMRFYESLGYVAVRKDTWHRKWLAAPAGARDDGLY
ncbi:MAG: GNAT family N-acetyltransferase [Spirochaetaceae bacterium]|nr:GNAT family N-acetyltransferase [Spirochaetaceae bacterium]